MKPENALPYITNIKNHTVAIMEEVTAIQKALGNTAYVGKRQRIINNLDTIRQHMPVILNTISATEAMAKSEAQRRQPQPGIKRIIIKDGKPTEVTLAEAAQAEGKTEAEYLDQEKQELATTDTTIYH